jgi:hypothetical protein
MIRGKPPTDVITGIEAIRRDALINASDQKGIMKIKK